MVDKKTVSKKSVAKNVKKSPVAKKEVKVVENKNCDCSHACGCNCALSCRCGCFKKALVFEAVIVLATVLITLAVADCGCRGYKKGFHGPKHMMERDGHPCPFAKKHGEKHEMKNDKDGKREERKGKRWWRRGGKSENKTEVLAPSVNEVK